MLSNLYIIQQKFDCKRKLKKRRASHRKTQKSDYHNFTFFTVLQRCFPDFSTKNGTLTVGNKTTFEDGSGKTRNAIELRAAAKYVCLHSYFQFGCILLPCTRLKLPLG